MTDRAAPTSLGGVVQAVLSETQATRVTIRLAAEGFTVAAEALAAGTPSVRGSRPDVSADPRVRGVLARQTAGDKAVAADLPPGDPRAKYRITAEIVTPITARDEIVGVMSVH